MKALYITITFFILLASSTSKLSDRIYKSQVKYYKSQDVKVNQIYHLRFLNEARKGIFKELGKNNLWIKNSSKLYIIEGYDYSCGELNAAIIIDDKIFYYLGSNQNRSYSLTDKPTIEKSEIQYYISKNYSELRNSLVMKSTGYIGTSVNLKKRREINHFSW